mmetsp:Transcript_19280/g.36929  ORF Transcript_19280/g.36929 Transcript_19280/m.36929 type:complete len:311 (+) Transcript_19280:593-1525(+)|eukprot:CAMPEP_0114242052 /NCGR_PEP_ID=MMETSP0058-20121206/9961_1 /TAXON_ID=36894 /ORGANISM="Pyramimonas parkeae, CCMP726" /LENGTH=310 /DNA_ID=CAMNT_0001354621 /DNA_START=510 /DNA_END=1442 /DNA_ORIENTATION=+
MQVGKVARTIRRCLRPAPRRDTTGDQDNAEFWCVAESAAAKVDASSIPGSYLLLGSDEELSSAQQLQDHRMMQLALEAQPVAVGVPVLTGIGQPLAPRTVTGAALPGSKPLHDEEAASPAPHCLPRLAPPPASTSGTLLKGVQSPRWVAFDSAQSRCDRSEANTRFEGTKVVDNPLWETGEVGAATFAPCREDGALDAFEQEDNDTRTQPGTCWEGEACAEYWWSFAGQQKAVSEASGRALTYGEVWEFKRKGAVSRGLNKMRKRCEDAKLAPQNRSIGILSNPYYKASQGGDLPAPPSVSHKAMGKWKG